MSHKRSHVGFPDRLVARHIRVFLLEDFVFMLFVFNIITN